MKLRWLAALMASGLMAMPAAKAADPLPPPGYQPGMDTDEGGLWMQVDKEEDAIKTSPALIKDKALNEYVTGVVCKLAGDYCGSLRIYVLEVPEFNAFAMPNGAVVVYSGLLLRCQNEAQLAFVLGHEMTHFLHQHTLKHYRNVVNTSGFTIILNIGLAAAGAGNAGSLTNLVAASSLLSNSRDEERDADDGGFKAAVANGYDPNQAPLIWDNADKEYSVDSRRVSAFFSDHPDSKERMATMEKDAKDATGGRSEWITNEAAYNSVMTPFLSQWVADDLARGEPKQSAVLFERLTAQSPRSGLYQFALGEAYRKRNAADDEGRAVAAYRAALACDDAPAQAWRGLGLIAMTDGDKAGARQDFSQYQSKAPDADDKDMIAFYLTQL